MLVVLLIHGTNKNPKLAGNIIASSNIKIHKKILKMLKPVS